MDPSWDKQFHMSQDMEKRFAETEQEMKALNAEVLDLKKRLEAVEHQQCETISVGHQQSEEISNTYSSLVQLTIHGQENKWQTLYIFLVFNSILLLAWTNVFVAEVKGSFEGDRKHVLWAFCAVGFLSGLLWSILGKDYAAASILFSDLTVKFERDFALKRARPLHKRQKQRDKKGSIPTSRTVIVVTPLIFSILYTFLLQLAQAPPIISFLCIYLLMVVLCVLFIED